MQSRVLGRIWWNFWVNQIDIHIGNVLVQLLICFENNFQSCKKFSFQFQPLTTKSTLLKKEFDTEKAPPPCYWSERNACDQWGNLGRQLFLAFAPSEVRATSGAT